jgi:hypothetical protein
MRDRFGIAGLAAVQNVDDAGIGLVSSAGALDHMRMHAGKKAAKPCALTIAVGSVEWDMRCFHLSY